MPATTTDPTTDLYAVLGVARTATDGEIRDAVRRLRIRYTTDKQADGPDHWSEYIIRRVNEAAEVLGDPEKRAEYDARPPEEEAAPAAAASHPLITPLVEAGREALGDAVTRGMTAAADRVGKMLGGFVDKMRSGQTNQ